MKYLINLPVLLIIIIFHLFSYYEKLSLSNIPCKYMYLILVEIFRTQSDFINNTRRYIVM